MKIDLYISDLLYKHDCVIVPQLGGFVANPKSAKADPVLHKFSPPSKEISFNSHLINNDGLLANHIATKEEKTYSEANNLIAEDVERKKKKLREENRVHFENIGTLYYDSGKNTRFEPDNSINYSLGAFGLESLHALPIPAEGKQETEKEEAAKMAKVRHKIIPDEQRTRPSLALEKKQRFGRYIPHAIASLPLIAYLIWLPLQTDVFSSGNFNYSNLIPFTEKKCEKYKARINPVAPLSANDEEKSILLSAPDTAHTLKVSFFPEEEHKLTVKLRKSSAPSIKSVNNKDRFHVIGGCFQYFENAENLVEKLRKEGYNASILDQNKGLYRVIFQSYTSRAKARELLASVKTTHNSSAWLLVK